jgi:hypothetical protein
MSPNSAGGVGCGASGIVSMRPYCGGVVCCGGSQGIVSPRRYQTKAPAAAGCAILVKRIKQNDNRGDIAGRKFVYLTVKTNNISGKNGKNERDGPVDSQALKSLLRGILAPIRDSPSAAADAIHNTMSKSDSTVVCLSNRFCRDIYGWTEPWNATLMAFNTVRCNHQAE